MPDMIKSLKKENDDLKLEVSSLKSDLKNLEASIERRITQSNVQHGDRST
jgi:regulator of replication initiation timing